MYVFSGDFIVYEDKCIRQQTLLLISTWLISIIGKHQWTNLLTKLVLARLLEYR